MLKKFTVKNFKNFKEKIVLDFSKVHEYEFNQNLIKNNLINKLLIYGPNNSGKSNLGAAIMDITTHLTDNYGDNLLYLCYKNYDSIDDTVDFSYEFLFGDTLFINILKMKEENYLKKSLLLMKIQSLNIIIKQISLIII